MIQKLSQKRKWHRSPQQWLGERGHSWYLRVLTCISFRGWKIVVIKKNEWWVRVTLRFFLRWARRGAPNRSGLGSKRVPNKTIIFFGQSKKKHMHFLCRISSIFFVPDTKRSCRTYSAMLFKYHPSKLLGSYSLDAKVVKIYLKLKRKI